MDRKAFIDTWAAQLKEWDAEIEKLEAKSQKATEEMPAVVIGYGRFIQTIIDFTIISVVIFFVVKTINSIRRKEEAQEKLATAPSTQEVLLTEIRNLLKEKR